MVQINISFFKFHFFPPRNLGPGGVVPPAAPMDVSRPNTSLACPHLPYHVRVPHVVATHNLLCPPRPTQPPAPASQGTSTACGYCSASPFPLSLAFRRAPRTLKAACPWLKCRNPKKHPAIGTVGACRPFCCVHLHALGRLGNPRTKTTVQGPSKWGGGGQMGRTRHATSVRQGCCVPPRNICPTHIQDSVGTCYIQGMAQ